MRRNLMLVWTLGLFLFVLASVPAGAQTTAPGPYLATPAWDQQITCNTLATCQRFVVLSNWNSEAVLDRESGLVWERSPDPAPRQRWSTAVMGCVFKSTGGRFGWRLPTIQELLSLATPDASGEPHLPAGHPFVLSAAAGYWTSTTSGFPPDGGTLESAWGMDFTRGDFLAFLKSSDDLNAWCVRGGSGLDGQ